MSKTKKGWEYITCWQHENFKDEMIHSYKILGGRGYIVNISKYMGKPEMIHFSEIGEIIQSINPLGNQKLRIMDILVEEVNLKEKIK